MQIPVLQTTKNHSCTEREDPGTRKSVPRPTHTQKTYEQDRTQSLLGSLRCHSSFTRWRWLLYASEIASQNAGRALSFGTSLKEGKKFKSITTWSPVPRCTCAQTKQICSNTSDSERVSLCIEHPNFTVSTCHLILPSFYPCLYSMCLHAHTYVCIYVCLYLYVYTCINIHTCTHIYI